MLRHPKSWTLGSRRTFALTVILVCGMANAQLPPAGKGQGVEVQSVTPKLVDAHAGEIVNLSFRVTSHAAAQELFVESLKLPDGWQALVPLSVFALQPGEMTARVVAVAVPHTTPAGRYEVAYSVRSQRDYGIQDAETAAIVVQPAGNLLLLLDQSPGSIIAGEQYVAKIRAVNQGNAPLRVKLSAVRDDQHLIPVDPPSLTLAPGASGVASLTIKTSADERKPRRQFVFVTAEGQAAQGKPLKAVLTVAADLIPRVTAKADFHRRIPATLTLLGVSETGTGLQAELTAHGAIDEAGQRCIDFLLRAPDIQDKSIYGQRDEYRASYASPDLDVQLGDQGYGLSRLTDCLRYGRGLGFNVHRPGEPEVGAYYLRTRWESPSEEEVGAHVAERFSDRFSAGINYLSRQREAGDLSPSTASHFWSLQANLRPLRDTNLRLEYALGDSNQGGADTSDTAYDIGLDGRIGSSARGARCASYSLAKTHAGPDYFGYYHDSDYLSGSIVVPLADRLQAHASAQTWAQNLDLRTDHDSAPREDLRQFGLSYTLGQGWYASADFDDFATHDALTPSTFDFGERDVRLAVGRSTDKYGLRGEIRTGRQQDRLTGDTEHVTRYNIFATYRPGPSQFFTLYGGVGDNNALSQSRFLSESNNVGASFVWLPRDDLALQLSYLKYGFSDGDRAANDQFEFHAAYKASPDQSWALQVRHCAPGGDTEAETSLALSYVYTFGLPVGTKSNIGGLAGRVFDADKPDKPGIADVILTVSGATAVTDRDGKFSFPTLAPGPYQLRLADGPSSFKRTSTTKLPLAVQVVAAQTKQVELGMVAAATLAGSITLVSEAPGVHDAGGYVAGGPTASAASSEPASGGLRDVLIEVSSGDQTLRATTDYRGEFRFTGLAPGKWKVKVYDGNLPAYHRLEQSEVTVELKPGQVSQALLKVVPEQRHIKIIDEQTAPLPTVTASPKTPVKSISTDVPVK